MSNQSTPTRVERPSRPSPNLALDASLYAKNRTNGVSNTRSSPQSPFQTNFLHAHLSESHAEPSSAREGRNAPPSTPLPTGMSRSTSATEPRGLHASNASRFHQSHSFSNSPVIGSGGMTLDSSPDSSPLSSPAGPRSMLSPGIITRAGAAEEASKIRLPSVSAGAQGVVSPTRNGTSANSVAPRTLSYAVSGVDEYPEEDEEEEEEEAIIQRNHSIGGLPIKPSSNSQLTSRYGSQQTHPEPPFHVKDVSRGGNNSSKKSQDSFPPFSPSELRPYSSPSPSSKLTYRSASHLEAQHAEDEFLNVPAAATQSGFSPKHANWDQSHPYDESYEVEGSDDGKTPSASPKQSPLRRPASIPQFTATSSPPPLRMNSQRQTAQMMSPTTRSAVDSIVPALSWLLILNRKLQLSGAITALQSKHLKSQILAGNPALLSAVDRFVKGKNQDAIIQALMSCLPEDEIDNSVDAAREAAREAEDEEDEDDDGEEQEEEEGEDDEDDEFEADYKAIMHGRGQGGHKPTPTRARTAPGMDAAKMISSPRLDFGTGPAGRDGDDDEEESDDEEDENPLLIANTLIPLSLPQLENLGSLLRSLGFSMLDMETLSLCTSALLTPIDRNSNASGAGVTVSSAQWNECIKSLRLHSHNPKLFTQLLQSLFRILDLQQSDSVPYGELVSSIAVFCRGKPKQKLQFIFQALRHSSGGGFGGSASTPSSTSSAFSHNSSPSSPTDPSISYLPCTIIYGFLFSFSLTLHVLLALALSPSNAALEQRLDTVTQTINVQNKAVWSLTNGFYALFDRQFETAGGASSEDQDATITYKQFVQWHHSPVFIMDTLLERSGQ